MDFWSLLNTILHFNELRIQHFHTPLEQVSQRVCCIETVGFLATFKLKILTAMTGWDKSLHLLRIFGLLRWDATHFWTQNSPDLSRRRRHHFLQQAPCSGLKGGVERPTIDEPALKVRGGRLEESGQEAIVNDGCCFPPVRGQSQQRRRQMTQGQQPEHHTSIIP